MFSYTARYRRHVYHSTEQNSQRWITLQLFKQSSFIRNPKPTVRVCIWCTMQNVKRKKRSKTELKLQRSSGVLRDHHHHHNCKLEEDGNLPCLCAKERKRKTAAVRVSVAANRTEEKGKWHFHEWSKAGCVDVLCCVVRTWEIIIKLSSASCNGRKKPLCFGTPAVQNSSSRHRYLERPRRPPLSDTI